MHLTTVFNILGRLTLVYAGVMLIPFVVALIYFDRHPEAQEPIAFGVAAFVTALIGFLLQRYCPADMKKFGHREGFAIVTFGWLLFSLLGALPYCLLQDPFVALNYLDAVFETISGLTTTGATVLTDIEKYGRGILFWRAMTQWLGGMGVVVMAVAILPSLGAAGYSLLRAEVPGPTADKIAPRIAQTAKILWGVYILFTVVLTLLLWAPSWFDSPPVAVAAETQTQTQTHPQTVPDAAVFAGMAPMADSGAANMDLYEAICHTFATVSTGGFSTRNDSIAAFTAYHHYVVIAFMFMAGVNFLLHYQLLIGRPQFYWKSSEWRVYGGAIVVVTVLIFVGLNVLPVNAAQGHGDDRISRTENIRLGLIDEKADFVPAPEKYATPESTFRHTLFQVVSIVTSTGFGTADFDAWPDFCRFMIMCLMFLGGCAGSTAGGLKVIRVMVVVKHAFNEFQRLVYPHAVAHVKVGGERVNDKVINAVIGVFTLYLMLLILGIVILTNLDGFDLTTAFSCSTSMLSNIGPGLGKVGPTQNYAWIPDIGKIICCMLMLLGRLEIYTILVLFLPAMYRK